MWLKIAFLLAILWYLISRVDTKRLWECLFSLNLFWILLNIFISIIGLWLLSLRWKILLLGLGYKKPSIKSLFCYNLLGAFYSLFIPTQISNEVARGVKLYKDIESKADVGISILLDRLIGIISLIIIAIISTLIVSPVFFGNNLLLKMAFLGMAVISGFFLILNMPFFKRFSGSLSLLKKENPWLIFLSFTLSIITQLFGILGTLLVLKSLDVRLSFFTIGFISSLAILSMLIPISVGGISLREGAYLILFEQFGIAREKAFILTGVIFGISFFFGIAGGIIEIGRGGWDAIRLKGKI
ncbi:MAG: lysylphosphatidylglycerol synthase transmembrane domain-containing protein [bacterium]